MVTSIIDDIKGTFRSGNMISKIILVNVALFVVINLICALGPSSFCNSFSNFLSLPSDPGTLIRQPWSIFTHMFLHEGFFHLLWNMLFLYWFGQIVGDLLGDGRVLPIYIMSGLLGGLVYILHVNYGSTGSAYAMGASAAVMAVIWTGAMTSPDYMVNMLFIGRIPLKYIALTLLVLDIIGTGGDINKGGYWAHLGGALFGILYVNLLHRGTDLTLPFRKSKEKYGSRRSSSKPVTKTSRSKFKIVHNSAKSDDAKAPKATFNQQDELDRILDKINSAGYDKLSAEEKDFLYKASKKK